MVFHQSYKDRPIANDGIPDAQPSLTAFRSWADYWRDEARPASMQQTSQPRHRSNTRRTVWRLYYLFLSDILYNATQYSPRKLPDPSNNETPSPNTIHWPSHYAELRNVEKAYERILLNEISFPKANEVNHEVDEWTDQVMSNWSIVCGPGCQDDELGEGGKELASRNVLDVSQVAFFYYDLD